MKILLLTLLVCFAFVWSSAQSKKVPVKKTINQHVYNTVEKPPEPEGGVAKLLSIIAKNIMYPSGCENIGSRVIISFIVEADGSTDHYVVIKDPCSDKHLLADQLFKLISKVKWKPGKMKGKPVATYYSLPLQYA